jgi:hypothetical protein
VLSNSHVDLGILGPLLNGLLLLLALHDTMLHSRGVALVHVLEVLGVGVALGLSLGAVGLSLDVEEESIKLVGAWLQELRAVRRSASRLRLDDRRIYLPVALRGYPWTTIASGVTTGVRLPFTYRTVTFYGASFHNASARHRICNSLEPLLRFLSHGEGYSQKVGKKTYLLILQMPNL